MATGGPVTIGESMAMAALMTGKQAEEVTAFVVLVADAEGNGAIVHNCQSYLNLITFLLEHVRSLVDEMQVDQVIEFSVVPES